MSDDQMQPPEPKANPEQPKTPARYFIQIVPSRYVVYVRGMRFMLDTEIVAQPEGMVARLGRHDGG